MFKDTMWMFFVFVYEMGLAGLGLNGFGQGLIIFVDAGKCRYVSIGYSVQ